MRRLLTLICLIFSVIAHAQKDTAFFDTNWKELPDRENAAFFRPWPKEENGKYKLVDYYISGQVQMRGYYKSANIVRLADFGDNDEYRDGRFEYFNPDGSRSKIAEYTNDELNGEYKEYDSTGKLELETTYVAGNPDGLWKSYHNNGKLRVKGNYVNSMMNGAWKTYYEDGKLWLERNYVNDSLDGTLKSYYKNGKLKRNASYKSGKLVKGVMYDRKGKSITYTEFRIMPVPNYDLTDYLVTNIKYPEKARMEDKEGQVHVQFTVAKDGSIVNAKVSKSVHPLLDAEALRVVSEMPPWQPGKMDDEPVDVYYTLPVTFRLQ